MSASRLLARDGEPLPPEALARLALPDGAPIIDLHSGGEDNIFPHHECEIAQSCSAFNAEPERGPFARTWFHPRFLLVEGEKMSKSKGNFFTARDLFEGRNPSGQHYEPAAVRLELIKTHYRSNANFTEQGLRDAQRMVERWRRFVEGSGDDRRRTAEAGSTAEGERAREEFGAAMNEDLNVAAAIAAVNTLVGKGRPGPGDAALLGQFDAVLGILERERPAATTSEIGVFAPGVTPDARVVRLLEERRAARAAKNFARSDEIRDEIARMGFAIKDVAGGKVEVTRK
jgi:cysteinyl-tRNA synthetase